VLDELYLSVRITVRARNHSAGSVDPFGIRNVYGRIVELRLV
jgi:hypothetical protein